MARASQGLLISARVGIKRTRLLPMRGEVLVEAGREVEMDEIVARALLPGALHMVNAAGSLGVRPAELPGAALVNQGDTVSAGQVLAEVKAFFGFITNRVISPIDGTIESISKLTGQIILRAAPRPLEVAAYLPGVVTEVIPGKGVEIEAEVALAQGIFGLGGEVFGVLRNLHDKPGMVQNADSVSKDFKDSVLVSGGPITLDALRAAIKCGARAAVAASARGADLIDLAGGALNPASTGDEKIGLTLVLTEGLGSLAMADHTFELLTTLEGAMVSVNGATQIRAGVMRPEIIALPKGSGQAVASRGKSMGVDDRIRIVRGEAFGKVGRIISVPSRPALIGSGAKALVFEVETENGARITVPRPNVEPV